MSFGYHGKILRVNLTDGKISIEEPSDVFYRTYLGGRGFVVYYLLKEVPPDIDPYSPANKLIFAPGLVCGAAVSGLSRFAVGAKSPLSEGYGQAEAGGFWGPEFRRTGFDALIVEGKSEKPVYISIVDDKVEIRDGAAVWGKTTGETQKIIREEMGDDKVQIVSTGRGGERLIRYACMINDLHHANGRCGMGAVMGSKNLKGIAVRGSIPYPVADPQRMSELAKRFATEHMKQPAAVALLEYGTTGAVAGNQGAGMLPTRNFRDGEFEGADKIGGQYMNEHILKGRHGCFACVIRCKRVVSEYGGPEYETLAAFGSLIGNDDIEAIAKVHDICNAEGIDTISAGTTIAFVMECYEKGFITKEQLGGVDARFGNIEAAMKLLDMIVKREGFGDEMAEGSWRLSEKLGAATKEFCICVHKQELAMHDPRGKVGVGLGYALCDTGADHMYGLHDTLFQAKGAPLDSMAAAGFLEPCDALSLEPRKVQMFTYGHWLWSFFDAGGFCKFGPAPRSAMPLKEMIGVIEAATGWDTSLFELLKCGERFTTMARLYNNACGYTSADDTLPERLYGPLGNGKLKGVNIDKSDFLRAIKLFYGMSGWDAEGVPTEAKLYELKLDWLVEEQPASVSARR